jgi:hypothetical protein
MRVSSPDLVDVCLVIGVWLWLVTLVFISAVNFRALFLGRRGRFHRVLGLVEILLLNCVLFDVLWPFLGVSLRVFVDVGLGVMGALLAISALLAFDHAKVHALQKSGTLDEHALVSNAEMLEHSFFQILNSAQMVYLYCLSLMPSNLLSRLCLCWVASWPWLFRSWFPINSFSANYGKQADPRSSAVIRFLYRGLKKKRGKTACSLF